MHPMHASYILGLEKLAGIGAFLAKGVRGLGKGVAGLGVNMAASELTDHVLQKSPQVNKMFVHPAMFQRMQAAQRKGEDPQAIVKRFMSPPARSPGSMLGNRENFKPYA